MKIMSAVPRTGFGLNAHTIYVGAIARQAGLLAGSGRLPASAPAPVPVKPPVSMPVPQKQPAYVPVPRRRPAYIPAPARPVSSEFFEDY